MHKTLIVDFGSYQVKAGFSGDIDPRLLIENVVGIDKYPNVTGFEKNQIGLIDKSRKWSEIVHPVVRGKILNVHRIFEVFDYVYSHLKLEGEISSVILCHSPSYTVCDKEAMIQHMFETLKVEKVYMGDHGKFVVKALDMSSGVVVECGHGIIESIPVYNDYYISNSSYQIPFAGSDITSHLMKLLTENNQSNYMMNDVAHVQMLKEKFAEILPFPDDTHSGSVAGTTSQSKLFDNKDNHLGDEKFLCGEPLFRPFNMDHTKDE